MKRVVESSAERGWSGQAPERKAAAEPQRSRGRLHAVAAGSRKITDSINGGPSMQVQRKQIEGIQNSPRMAAQRRQIKSMFGDTVQLMAGPDEKEFLQGQF